MVVVAVCVVGHDDLVVGHEVLEGVRLLGDIAVRLRECVLELQKPIVHSHRRVVQRASLHCNTDCCHQE